MFATGAFVLIVIIGWYCSRTGDTDEPSRHDDAAARDLIRHARQDVRLIAYLLAGILVMLGLIADRIH